MQANFVTLFALVIAVTAFSAQAAPVALGTEAALDSRKLVGSGEFGHRSLDQFDERGLDLVSCNSAVIYFEDLVHSYISHFPPLHLAERS